jgi:drug/metabolite transporter (DMT)-like permease
MKSGKNMEMNKYKIAISAACDLIASTLQCISLNFIQASSYQMMRGGTIATTLFFSVAYFNKKPQKSHIFGGLLCIIGVLMIGIENVIYA